MVSQTTILRLSTFSCRLSRTRFVRTSSRSRSGTLFSSARCRDTIPTRTHENADFFSYVHHSASSAHFQRGHTALAQGEKESVSRIRLHSFPSRLTVRCRTYRFLFFIKSYPHLLPISQPSATSTSFGGSGQNSVCFRSQDGDVWPNGLPDPKHTRRRAGRRPSHES